MDLGLELSGKVLVLEPTFYTTKHKPKASSNAILIKRSIFGGGVVETGFLSVALPGCPKTCLADKAGLDPPASSS